MAILEVNNLNITIDKTPRILEGCFEVNPGEVVLLTGPNGCGKSTVIKIIMGDIFDYKGLDYSKSSIKYYVDSSKPIDVLGSEKEREVFRKNVCYVSQEDEFESPAVIDCFKMSLNYCDIKNKDKYIFDFILNHGIYKAFITDDELDSKAKSLARRLKLKNKDLTEAEKSTLLYMTKNIKRMSGGQKKITNIATNLIRYSFCNMIILDEPLNNLDYSNVRVFSNMLTSICREKTNLGVVIVTHCRSIPIINKIVEVKDKKLVDGGVFSCSSCFGKINEKCMYE